MEILQLVLQVVIVVTSILCIMFVLLNKGKGGGLSDMFGGGISSSASASGVAERNLNRITVGMALIWGAAAVGLGIVERFL